MASLLAVHDIPGRLRLRLPPAAKSAGVEEPLRQHPGVVACAWSPLTRSLLIHYRPGATTSQALIDTVAAHTGALPGAAADVAPDRHLAPAAPSGVARALSRGVSDLNANVARLTGGAMDLRILLPLALGAWALREVIRGAVSPLAWSTALWYAHGLFRDYNLPGNEG